MEIVIDKKETGWNATIKSPDQSDEAIPCQIIRQWKDSLYFQASSIGLSFEGKWDSASESWKGVIRQGLGAYSMELIRTPLSPPSPMRRPQNPTPPFPYHERDASIVNEKAGITLHGTLTLPFGKGPYACAVLISGSGPQNRDEELLGHRPFFVLSDYLTRQGLAVLRIDDRGTAESEGDFSKATSMDFATDVIASMKWLTTQKEIDPLRIGLIGHSEGGMIAPMVAAMQPTPAPAFIISLAGTGVKGQDVLLKQNHDILLAQGSGREEAERRVALLARVIDALVHEQDSTLRSGAVYEYIDSQIGHMSEQLPNFQEVRKQQAESLLMPWMPFFLAYDPSKDWRKVTCPVLAMNGEKDLQVNASDNLRAISAALDSGNNTNYTTLVLPGVNHLFQHCSTGVPDEYGQLEETFAPEALEYMVSWIKKQKLL